MILYNVFALTNGSGYYRTIIKLPNSEETPQVSPIMAALGYCWSRIAHNVSEDEARAVMAQYPHATQMKRIMNG